MPQRLLVWGMYAWLACTRVTRAIAHVAVWHRWRPYKPQPPNHVNTRCAQDIAAVVSKYHVDGLIVSNTTISRPGVEGLRDFARACPLPAYVGHVRVHADLSHPSPFILS